MKDYRIASVDVVGYPIVRVRFDDGFTEDFDLGPFIARGGVFAALADRDLFQRVSVDEHGRCLGWRMDEEGSELDFGADSLRTDLELQRVRAMADAYRQRQTAAE